MTVGSWKPLISFNGDIIVFAYILGLSRFFQILAAMDIGSSFEGMGAAREATFVASTRHADGVVITGPITQNMAKAAEICYEAVPNPKIIILFGACAISGGIFQNSEAIERKFLGKNKIDLYIPGSPPHPLTFINGLLDWLNK